MVAVKFQKPRRHRLEFVWLGLQNPCCELGNMFHAPRDLVPSLLQPPLPLIEPGHASVHHVEGGGPEP